MVRAGKLLLWIITFLFVIAAAYEFQGVFKPLGDYTFVSQALRGSGKEVNRFKSSFAARIPIPLPEHLVHGVDIQKKDFESKMPSYFLGEWRNYGWYEYYIVSWLIKEPPTFWLMITIGLFVSKFKFTREELFLHFPGLLIFAFVSSQTGFNHHLRYTLPVFPCFVILATRWIQPKISHLTMASLCVVLYVCSTMGVYPRTYAYFSEAVGGASQGWKYLGYSNLDWGQDVRTIYEWIDEHRELTPVFAFESTPYGRSLSPYDVKFAERYCVEKDGVLYPNAVGWWMIPNRAYIEGKSRWFRENEPSAMLSVTTRLYRIDQCRLDAIRAKYLSQSDAQP